MQPSNFFYEPPLTPEEEYLLSLDYDIDTNYYDLILDEFPYKEASYINRLLTIEPEY